MVEEWDRWRRSHAPTESALIVHGPNSDVDLVNELAQRKRLDSGELGEQAIRAVDRDYLLRPGDVVAIRNAAYTFQSQPGEPRLKRIENGQTAIIESVGPERDTLTLLLREPGAEPRLVEVDQARLRKEHAAGKRAAAVRLNYALHTFPAQGATVHGTATLAGHWSQAKQETYVGDTRAIYRHSVHLAREDLGTDGTDEDRIGRYAQRISTNRQRHASIRQTLDRTRRLAVDLPKRQPLPRAPSELGPRDPSPETSPREMSQSTAAPAAASDTSREASAVSDRVPAAARAGPGAARASAVGSARASDPRARTTSQRTDRTRAMGARGATAPGAPPPSPHRRAGRATTTLPHRSRPIPTPACFAPGTNAAQRPDDPTLGLPARPPLHT